MAKLSKIKIPDKERSAIAFYHSELEALSDLVEEQYGAEVDIPNITGDGEQRRRFPKRIIRVGVEAQATVLASCQRIEKIHELMMDKFKKQVFRAINVPQVYHDVNYASLTINQATSVKRLDDYHSDIISDMRRFIYFTTNPIEKNNAQKQLKRLEKMDLEDVRLVNDSGLSFQLYIYDSDTRPKRCNVNHATFLIGVDDGIPELVRQRPRRKRSDVKTRKIAVKFDGGTIVNDDGVRERFRPVSIFYK